MHMVHLLHGQLINWSYFKMHIMQGMKKFGPEIASFRLG